MIRITSLLYQGSLRRVPSKNQPIHPVRVHCPPVRDHPHAMNQYPSKRKISPSNSAKPDLHGSRRRTASGSGPDSAIFHFVPSAEQGGEGNEVQRSYLQAYPGPARLRGCPQTSTTTMRRLSRVVPRHQYRRPPACSSLLLETLFVFHKQNFRGRILFLSFLYLKKLGLPDKVRELFVSVGS